jgi:hypothetical protein
VKKLIISLCLFLPAFALVAEDDLASQVADLQKRTQALEERLDEMERKDAAVDPANLTQELQWGKGWSFDLSEGQQGYSNILELGLASPRLANMFSLEFRGGWLCSDSLIVHHGDWSADGTNPRHVAGNGAQATLRGIVSTPLLFSFSRLYGGAEELFSYMYWDLSSDETLAANPVFYSGPIYYYKYYCLNTFLFGGFEGYLSKWASLYLEASYPIEALSWKSAWGSGWSYLINSGDESYYGLTVKLGVRLYLPNR